MSEGGTNVRSSLVSRSKSLFLAPLVTGILCALPTPAGAQRFSCDTACRRREPINILQGVDSTAFLDTARIRIVTEALATIRLKLPQLADIREERNRTYLVLYAPDSAPLVFLKRSHARRTNFDHDMYWDARVKRSGIRAIDSLNRVFDVSEIFLRMFDDKSELALFFRRPVNTLAVKEAYNRVPHVEIAMNEMELGDGSWIKLLRKGDRYLFIFSRGGGDCPAGCTERDYYYVAYDSRDRSVALEHEVLNDTKRSEPIFPWDVPQTRYAFDMYPTVDSLYAGLHARPWWYRSHAVHALALLLGTGSEPGAGEQARPEFTAFRKAVNDRRRESFRALIDRLSDEDADVARLAHTYLINLTGQRYPGGVDGIPRWQQWLRELL